MRARPSVIASVAFLAVAHVVSVYWQVSGHEIYVVRLLFGETVLLLIIAFALPMFADFMMGTLARSRLQFIFFALLAIGALQIEGLFLDWTAGRFWTPWIEENYLRWGREIFWRFVFPAAFVTLGALVGTLLRRNSFVLRSKHA